ncbi:rab-GTPase-TBC domain-containing protein [Pavlovales sp. CCMP2436]|nr:rab-GTPase-TBC domain-containing protein [Pavlovales sp. CCMP2436]
MAAPAPEDGCPVSSEDEWEEVETPREFDAHGFPVDRIMEELVRATLGAREIRRASAHERRWRESGLTDLAEGRMERARELARGGVPDDLRPSVWKQLASVDEIRSLHPDGYYEQCAKRGSRAKSEATAQIDLDLCRTFPGHRVFETKEGCLLLRRVLAAFAEHDQHIGYVQGMGFVCGLLLIVARYEEEEAFWLLVAFAQRLLPLDYLTPAMLGLRTDQRLMAQILDEHLPRLGAHLDNCGVLPEVYSTKWLLCAYVTAMPVETVLRVWDALFADGNCALFRVALAFLHSHEKALLAMHDQGELLQQLVARARVTVDGQALLALGYSRWLLGAQFSTELLDRLRAQEMPVLLASSLSRSPSRAQSAATNHEKKKKPPAPGPSGERALRYPGCDGAGAKAGESPHFTYVAIRAQPPEPAQGSSAPPPTVAAGAAPGGAHNVPMADFVGIVRRRQPGAGLGACGELPAPAAAHSALLPVASLPAPA